MNLEQECRGGKVDVRTCTREDPCMGRHQWAELVDVVRLQVAWSDRSRLIMRRYGYIQSVDPGWYVLDRLVV